MSSRCRPLFALLLLASGLAGSAAHAELRVGVAAADITPPVGGRLYGYGARGSAVSTGVHDPLFAKVLVAADSAGTEVAVVTLDLGGFEKPRTARVREQVRTTSGIEHLILIASHSHSAPAWEPDFPDPEDPYPLAAEAEIVAAVGRARAALRPARLAVGWSSVEEGHNRRQVLADGSVHMRWANREREPTAPVDHALGIVAFDTPDGEPIATLVNFACHPVVLGPENLEISADYPGAMMARIEAEGGGQAMFVPGAAGDINPFWDKTPPAEGGFERMRAMGERLAAAALVVRGGLGEWRQVERLSIRQQEVALAARWDLDDPAVEAAFKEQGLGSMFLRYLERFERERPAEVSTLLFDRYLALGAFPGEFFVEHGLDFKRGSVIPHTLFAGYANGQLGYFPTVRAAVEGGYGGRSATIVEVGAGERLVTLALVTLHYQAGLLSPIPNF